jgi:omega-amidase
MLQTPALSIAALQTSLHWEDKAKNLHHINEKIRAFNEPCELLMLPEMFSTGFSMSPEKFAEESDGPTLNWMRELAASRNFAVTGSFIVKENGNFYNRLYWVNPDGTYQFYNKRHLFRMAGEDRHYSAGHDKLIIDFKGWKICPMVCYDLRFPVWSRNKSEIIHDKRVYDYDLLLYVANWPERRSYAWKTLLAARAIENLAYVAGVNRIGNDGNFIYHSGDSAIYNFKGEVITSALIATEEVIYTGLSKQELDEFRKSFPAGADADTFELK